MEVAKQHFETAIKAAPSLAEAHYNLGMGLYEKGVMAEARPHFMKAADLGPGNKVIWSSPPLSGISVPSKFDTPSDGHGHSH